VVGGLTGAAAVQAVRNGAGPRTVVQGTNGCPTGGTSFNSATNIQTLITGTSNAVFVAAATGAYTNFRGISYGDTHPRFVFPGLASSYSITGPGAGTHVGLGGGTGGGLEIYGGTWSQYGNDVAAAGYSAAAVLRGPSIIQDAVFTLSMKGPGVDNNADCLPGDTYLFSHCKFLSNLRYGLSGTATSGIEYVVTVEYCIVEDNNTAGRAGVVGYDPSDDAGPQKFGRTNNGIWRYNWFHDNYGFGIWCDGYNSNVRIHDNVVERDLIGIFYEISWGGTVIEHNYLADNAAGISAFPYNTGGITISNCPSDGSAGGPNITSEIRYNDISPNRPTGQDDTPIILFNHSGHAPGYLTRKWSVHHNRMWIRTTTAGKSHTGLTDICATGGPKVGDIGTSPGTPGFCLFDHNEYHAVNINGSWWRHDTASLSPGDRTWAQFRAAGHEANGTRVAI
jgi:hypothetical protein